MSPLSFRTKLIASNFATQGKGIVRSLCLLIIDFLSYWIKYRCVHSGVMWGVVLSQVCEWESRWNRPDLEAPPAAAVEEPPAQHGRHSAGVRSSLMFGSEDSLGPVSTWRLCSGSKALGRAYSMYFIKNTSFSFGNRYLDVSLLFYERPAFPLWIWSAVYATIFVCDMFLRYYNQPEDAYSETLHGWASLLSLTVV